VNRQLNAAIAFVLALRSFDRGNMWLGVAYLVAFVIFSIDVREAIRNRRPRAVRVTSGRIDAIHRTYGR